MSVEVLKSKLENLKAREEMRRRGIGCVDSKLRSLQRKAGLIKQVAVGDPAKSWDVLKTCNFIQKNLRMDSPILDIGVYGSEILCALHRLDFSELSGIDLNRDLKNMPNANMINYAVSDFMKCPYRDASFATITAISVIEHGFNLKNLLSELSRLLRSGGYFIASIDYWPTKIDTSNIKVYGMDWMIFSANELRELIAQSREYGFQPVGPMDFSADETTVEWQGKKYTFAWFCLQKT